jgi:hypothetical protein
MEQMIELLKVTQERMETQIGSLAYRMDANQTEMRTNQAKMEARIEANNEKSEVLQGTHVS